MARDRIEGYKPHPALQRDFSLKAKPFLKKRGIDYDSKGYQNSGMFKVDGSNYWYDPDEEGFFTDRPSFEGYPYDDIVDLLKDTLGPKKTFAHITPERAMQDVIRHEFETTADDDYRTQLQKNYDAFANDNPRFKRLADKLYDYELSDAVRKRLPYTTPNGKYTLSRFVDFPEDKEFADDVVDPVTGEVILKKGETFSKDNYKRLQDAVSRGVEIAPYFNSDYEGNDDYSVADAWNDYEGDDYDNVIARLFEEDAKEQEAADTRKNLLNGIQDKML